jgi:hypothetical protein
VTCPHERQEWRGRPLPCAHPACSPPADYEDKGLHLEWRGPGEHDTFDRVLLTTGTLALCGRAAHTGPPQQSWVWVRRGSVFNPRRG